jgi:peptidylprolyl isomerase
VKRRSMLTEFGPNFGKFPISLFLLVAVAVVFASGCKNTSKNANNVDDDPNAKPAVTVGKAPAADSQVAVLEMDNPAYGKIVIELYPNIAPKMVARFKELIAKGFYNGVTFHRVDPGLGIIQGGDPLSKDTNPGNDGSGDSDLPNVTAEFSDVPYDIGVVGAARQGAGGPKKDKTGTLTEKESWDTANCQFFIMTGRQPQFDKRYTVFGKVVSGQNNANIMANAPAEQGSNRPFDNIVIKTITLEPRTNYVK